MYRSSLPAVTHHHLASPTAFLEQNPVVRALMTRGFPTLVSLSLVVILATSNVPPNLYVISGTTAQATLVVYATVMAFIAVSPQRWPWIHTVGALLGATFYVGRGGGFLDLVLAGNTTLWGAVVERLVMASSIVMWHAWMGWRTQLFTLAGHQQDWVDRLHDHVVETLRHR